MKTYGRQRVEAEAEAAMLSQMALTSAAYIANGGLGLVVVVGVVYRAIGWKVNNEEERQRKKNGRYLLE